MKWRLEQQKVVLELGSLTVVERPNPFSFLPESRFFWSDKRYLQSEFGPFKSLSECMENYVEYEKKFRPAAHQETINNAEKSATDNVIYVDFKLKKRIG